MLFVLLSCLLLACDKGESTEGGVRRVDKALDPGSVIAGCGLLGQRQNVSEPQVP